MPWPRDRWGDELKPGGGYELFMWYFMRLSGLALVLLAVGHLFIMHILNNVETINYAFIAEPVDRASGPAGSGGSGTSRSSAWPSSTASTGSGRCMYEYLNSTNRDRPRGR